MEVDKKSTVLIVDDQVENIDILRRILKDTYKVIAVTDGKSALVLTKRKKPDIILLDIMMPEMDGYEVCRQLKQDFNTCDIPVIFVTAMSEEQDEKAGLEIGAVDYITKPISAMIVRQRIKTHLALYDHTKLLESQVFERTKKLEQSQLEIVNRLGRAAEYKDNETGLHVKRMSHFSQLLGKAAGMSDADTHLLLKASPMHDIGKIGIPDSILLKPGKLEPEEWALMMTHAQIGAEILSGGNSPLLTMAAEVALTHHEKWDGSGYPNQLKGEEIPLIGRIVAIADVFDALTSARPYKNAWSIEDAVALIKKESGRHFDPSLVPLFIDILPEVLEIRKSFAELY